MTWSNDLEKLKYIGSELQELEFLQKQYDEIEERLVLYGKDNLAIKDIEFHITRKALQSYLISSLARALDESKATSLPKLSKSSTVIFSSALQKRLLSVQKQYRNHIKPWRDKIIAHTDRSEKPSSVANRAGLTRQDLEDVTLNLIDIYDKLAKDNSLVPIWRYSPDDIKLPSKLFK